MRDTKLLHTHSAKLMREAKEKQLQRLLRKEVETGASGTQEYVIKKGVNTGKVAKGFQKSQS